MRRETAVCILLEIRIIGRLGHVYAYYMYRVIPQGESKEEHKIIKRKETKERENEHDFGLIN